MHEHRREDRNELSSGTGKETAGDKRPGDDECISGHQFYKKDQNIQGNKDICDDGDQFS
jgi:hypothetical protein